jgi:hypothetical protein
MKELATFDSRHGHLLPWRDRQKPSDAGTPVSGALPPPFSRAARDSPVLNDKKH